MGFLVWEINSVPIEILMGRDDPMDLNVKSALNLQKIWRKSAEVRHNRAIFVQILCRFAQDSESDMPDFES